MDDNEAKWNGCIDFSKGLWRHSFTSPEPVSWPMNVHSNKAYDGLKEAFEWVAP